MSIQKHDSAEFDLSGTGDKAWWDVPIGKPIQVLLDGSTAAVTIEGRILLDDGTYTPEFAVPKDGDGAAASYVATTAPSFAVYLNPIYREGVQLRMACTVGESGATGRFLA